MFFPKIKLSSLLNNWQLWAGLITVVLIAIGSLQTCRLSHWRLEAARLDGKLAEQQKDQDLLYGKAAKARATRNVERAEEAAERERLEASIKKAVAEGLVAKRALAVEKEKTAKLEPTVLVAAINQRIGDEASVTGAGLYLFTRVGTERTLNRFKDGEFHLSEYTKYKKVITEHAAVVVSFNTSIAECEAAVVDNLVGWEDCRETLATAHDDIKVLKKVGKASVWRGRKQGAVIVVLIAGGLKLAGVW